MSNYMDTSFTTPDDLWLGGFYEVAIQLGARSDERLSRAVAAIWNYPLVEGCYKRNDVNPEDQQRLSVSESARYQLETGMHIYGIAHFPENVNLVCGTVSVREDESEIDWLDFYLPAGAVDSIFGIVTGEPQSYSLQFQVWQKLEAWLAELGRHVFTHVPFSLGLVGYECSGMEYAADVAQNGIPAVRHIGYLWPEMQGVSFYPATK